MKIHQNHEKIIKKWSFSVKNVKKGQNVAVILMEPNSSKQGKTLTLLFAAKTTTVKTDKTDISHCL